jgi:hypothetical protein
MSNFSKVAYMLQELGFDYLRDNLSRNKEQLVMRWYILGCPLSFLRIVVSVYLTPFLHMA